MRSGSKDLARGLRRVPLLLAAASAVTLLAACGSTVQYSGTVNGTTGAAGLTGAVQQAGVNAIGGSSGGGSSGLGLEAPSAGTQRPGSASAPRGATSGNGPVPVVGGGPVTGRGFTKTTVKIGYATADDANASAGAFGIKGVTPEGDTNAQMAAVVADVNRRGGLLGRKIVLVPHDFNTVQVLSDPATANQAACATWTQDHQVFAVFQPPVVENTLLECLAKAGTPVIYAGGIEYPVHYAETYAKYPLFFNIAQMVGERFDRIAIRRLVERRFFSPWDSLNGRPGNASTPMKLGVVSAEDHDGDLALASKKRELARYGIKPTDVIRCPRALQAAVSCQQSAVLRLRQDGITHIFGVGYPFMINAENQQYRPRYFISGQPRTYAQNAPARQLVGSMGESYIPVMDVDRSEYPGDPTPATGSCKRIMRAAGAASDDPTTLWNQMIMCDLASFLKAAVEAAGGLGPNAVRTGFELLGSRIPSALTWGTFFGPREHTSATVLRDVEFRADIGRYAYTSKTSYREG